MRARNSTLRELFVRRAVPGRGRNAIATRHASAGSDAGIHRTRLNRRSHGHTPYSHLSTSLRYAWLAIGAR